ncbi:MAG: Ig-like domain-containing protein, partial [Actinomycetota bacterium]|nr:Ig-like domain-containing protein [Actinomycetota bacterium]
MRLRGTTGRRGGVALLAAAMLLAGCSTGSGDDSEPASEQPGAVEGSAVAEDTPEVTIHDNVSRRGVPVDTLVEVTAQDGTLQRVRVFGGPKGERGPVSGGLDDGGTAWTAAQPLEPGARYSIRTVAVDDEQRVLRETRKFRTDNLTLDEQTYPSIAPLEGETVGVGMPIIVTFDVPVTDRAAIERHLSVESTPQVRGAWHWYSDTEVHFRPRTFWKAGSDVTVHADINSVDAGNGVYGQLDRSVSFDIGDKVVSRIKVDKHRMDVF